MKAYSVRGGGGVKLHVEETGNANGKPILFIHGFSQCRLAWNKQLRSDLAKDFRLVAMDIRGHGLSDKPGDAYGDAKLWADDVDAVIRELGLQNAVLSGWSYGGVIITDYVAHYGEEQIAGTHWISAISRLGEPLVKDGFLSAEFLATVRGLFSENVTESIDALQKFLRLCVHEEPLPEDFYFFLGYNTAVPPHVRAGLFSRTLSNDAIVERMQKPMLLSYGEEDRIVMPAMSKHIAGLARSARLSLYPGVGHLPFWESPDRFNRELHEFRKSI